MFFRKMKIAASICAFNEEDYIAYCVKSVYDFADIIVLAINTGKPWGGQEVQLDKTLEIAKSIPDPKGKIRILADEWKDSNEQRNATIDLVRNDANYLMTVDADEIYTKEDLAKFKKYVMWRPWVGQFRIMANTYWKTNPFNLIYPDSTGKYYILSKIKKNTKYVGRWVNTEEGGVRFVAVRETEERPKVTVPRDVITLHHFAYSRTTERIWQKISNNMHRKEIDTHWYNNIWLKWDENPKMEDLHPVNPADFKRATPVKIEDLPEVMRDHPFAKAK